MKNNDRKVNITPWEDFRQVPINKGGPTNKTRKDYNLFQVENPKDIKHPQHIMGRTSKKKDKHKSFNLRTNAGGINKV